MSYAVAFTSQTTITILGSEHLLATKDLMLQVYDSTTPANAIPAEWTVDPSTFDIVISFITVQSGYVVVL